MLPAAYHWDHDPTGSYLRFNYRGVASMRVDVNGKWPHSIRWQGRELHGVAGSRKQAIRWIEAWLSCRSGLPAIPNRRSSRK